MEQRAARGEEIVQISLGDALEEVAVRGLESCEVVFYYKPHLPVRGTLRHLAQDEICDVDKKTALEAAAATLENTSQSIINVKFRIRDEYIFEGRMINIRGKEMTDPFKRPSPFEE